MGVADHVDYIAEAVVEQTDDKDILEVAYMSFEAEMGEAALVDFDAAFAIAEGGVDKVERVVARCSSFWDVYSHSHTANRSFILHVDIKFQKQIPTSLWSKHEFSVVRNI